MKQLRPYQINAVNAIIEHFNTPNAEKKVIVAMPTGTGKSLVIAKYIQLLYEWFPDVCIIMITHKIELILQNKKQLNEMAPQIPVSVYSASVGSKEISQITFAGIDSLFRITSKLPKADYVFIDECHLVSDKKDTMYDKILTKLYENNPTMKLIGFTATPWRMKDGLLTSTRWWDKIIFNLCSRSSFVDMVEQGFLCNLIPFAQKLEYNVTGVKTSAGDFNLKELQARVDTAEQTVSIVSDFVDKMKAIGCKKTLLFSSGLEHSKHIQVELTKHGLSSVIVDGNTEYTTRVTNIEMFKQGKVDILINYNILTTGFDCPDIDCIVVMRPTKSSVLWVQVLGRGSRPAPNKEYCVIFDYGGNTKRLGPINDPFIPKKGEWKKAGLGKQPTKECKHCGAINSLSARKCIWCGEEFPVNVQLTSNSSSEELITKKDFQIETYNVLRFFGEPYTSKAGNRVFRLSYDVGTTIFHDYIKTGGTGWGYQKSKELWGVFTSLPLPRSVDECVEIEEQGLLQSPAKIRVWLDTPNKYPKILNYIFEADEDIPF